MNNLSGLHSMSSQFSENLNTSFEITNISWSRKLVPEKNKEIIMCLRTLAILVSLVSIFVLARIRRSKKIFKYLLVISIVDVTYTFLVFCIGILTSLCYSDNHKQCGASLYLVLLILYISLSEYFTSCLAFFNITLEIFLTIQRISMFSDKDSSLKRANIKFVCSILFVTSVIYYMPVLGMNKFMLVEVNSRRDYRLIKTEFGNSEIARIILVFLNSFRIALVTHVLSILNVVIIFKLRSYLRKNLKIIRATNEKSQGKCSLEQKKN